MERTDSGLWLPSSFNVLRMRPTERTTTLRDGQRAKVTVDDSGTVTQIETAEQLHGIVAPKTIRLKVRSIGA